MQSGKEVIIYVKAFCNGKWFGAWTPVRAKPEWMAENERAGLFTLTEPDLDKEDEYEFFQKGCLMIAVLNGEDYKVADGVHADMFPDFWKDLPDLDQD